MTHLLFLLPLIACDSDEFGLAARVNHLEANVDILLGEVADLQERNDKLADALRSVQQEDLPDLANRVDGNVIEIDDIWVALGE